ncbi:Hyalin [Holothuria leucospilota]|uniref:Hyalin n=1 Tax=Holothuria leucospilota TaxID=206669 RepID=A0A9Q1C5L2_HOLLE|nr:Hyalin [Holothuria leucospilota]
MIELGAASPVISWVEPTATDLGGSSTIINQSHQIGTTFPIGTIQVTYVFSDSSGNIPTCSFNVEVTIGIMCGCVFSNFSVLYSIKQWVKQYAMLFSST